MTETPQINRKTVVAIVAGVFGVVIDDMSCPSRCRRLTRARFAACLLMSEMRPRPSLSQMAKALDRDHTTVMYALARATGMVTENPDFAAKVEAARAKIAAWRPGTPTGGERRVASAVPPSIPKRPPAAKISKPMAIHRPRPPIGGWKVEAEEAEWWRKNDLSFRAGMLRAHPELFGPISEAAE